MKIFVSWSGSTSRQIAELLRDWLPNVIQEAELFVSSQDIAKGARGLDIIGQNLESTNFGLLVLTSENAQSPWVNFEAGALSKSLVHGHVIPLLCGMAEVNIPSSPLRQFQHAKVEKEEMLRVVQDINQGCNRALTDEKVTTAFEKWWPDFSESYSKINLKPAKPQKEKDQAELNETVLEALGSIMSDLNSIRGEFRQQRHIIRRMDVERSSQANSLANALSRYGPEVHRNVIREEPVSTDESIGDILGNVLKHQK
ncbi:toll/interleukin-1 receptor domain-containing protein [Mesorhizobium sp. M0751]|uniref:TIR domain-containing protein n=1 Tax=unclassified Mesorhizobium TaxID=325217 RepID=UPI00333807B5